MRLSWLVAFQNTYWGKIGGLVPLYRPDMSSLRELCQFVHPEVRAQVIQQEGPDPDHLPKKKHGGQWSQSIPDSKIPLAHLADRAHFHPRTQV